MIIIGWIGLSIAVAVLAARYERNALAWLFVALLLSPLLGGALLLAFGRAPSEDVLSTLYRKDIPDNETIKEFVAFCF